jgi:hypothetical protein
MKKVYIFSYSDALGTREQIKDALNGMSIIETWRYDIPHTFYLVSESSARDISEALHKALGGGRFIVAEIGGNYWGRGAKDTWYFIQNKRVRPKP